MLFTSYSVNLCLEWLFRLVQGEHYCKKKILEWAGKKPYFDTLVCFLNLCYLMYWLWKVMIFVRNFYWPKMACESDMGQWKCRVATLNLDRKLSQPRLEEWEKWLIWVWGSLISLPNPQPPWETFCICHSILEKQTGALTNR